MRVVIGVFVGLFILFFVGWVKDIVKFTQQDFDAPYTGEILYGIGLIPTFGGVIGWINID